MFAWAVITTLATFALLVIGGMVNPTGSSLACPDWPLCHGSFFPKMVGGVFYEHTHRLVASAVGLFTLILGIWIWKHRNTDMTTRLLAILAVILVVVQGVLGGITVLWGLPPVISILHLCVSMLFFALLIVLCFRLWDIIPRHRAEKEGSDCSLPSHAFWWIYGACVVVFVQLILGACMRHFGAGRICGYDFVLCHGEIWPQWHLAKLHMIHRLFALVVMGWVVGMCIRVIPSAVRTGHRLLYGVLMCLPWLVLAQVALGIMTVASGVGLWEVTLHTAFGALLWGGCVTAALSTSRYANTTAVDSTLEMG